MLAIDLAYFTWNLPSWASWLILGIAGLCIVIAAIWSINQWVIFLVRRICNREKTAAQIASDRYAKGEITLSEYKEIKENLIKT